MAYEEKKTLAHTIFRAAGQIALQLLHHEDAPPPSPSQAFLRHLLSESEGDAWQALPLASLPSLAEVLTETCGDGVETAVV